MMGYVELWTTSNFSFLTGASHPEELVETAVAHEEKAIAITDRNTLAGIVRGHVAAKKRGIRFIPACRLDLLDGPSLLAYPMNKAGYARLSALLSKGNLRAEKGQCHLYREDVYQHQADIIFIIVPPDKLNNLFDFEEAFYQAVRQYKQAFGNRCFLAACRHYLGDDQKQLFLLDLISRETGVPLVATNNVHYHHPSRRELQDVLTCIREKCTIHSAGYRLHANAERYMKSPAEMERLFRQYPDALARTEQIARHCRFSLDELEYVYPKETVPQGRTPQQHLVHLVEEALCERFKGPAPDKVRRMIDHELKIIEELDYALYFLTVHKMCQYARDHQILYQGRGSAANSAVCYYLGITNVDPEKFDLLFERFISSARNEKPDIDIDFEHERREEVMQFIYREYGRDRAAIIATVTQVHLKTAVRDIGKVMGLSEDALARLSATVEHFPEQWLLGQPLTGQGFDPSSPEMQKIRELSAQYLSFPRQLGQHTGGFIITDHQLSDLCPIFNARMEDRTNIEWNKDDIEQLGFLKIDVLALGMLTAIRKMFQMAKRYYGKDYTLWNIPQDDPSVYAMIGLADTIGVFQIESRAQQSMLPRLRPRNFFDLVIEVAIVRPGPIQGDMVHPYLKRRNGQEPVEYPSKELEEVLKRTLGVPLFQEQAMKVVMVAAGFSATEADELRRGMATFKVTGAVAKFRDKVVSGMIRNGYTKEYALKLFRQLEGFGSYGFPESHAASFAHLVYISAYFKCYYPEIFVTAILNSLPMGYYQPAQLIADARRHGVIFLPVDVNASLWDYTLEPGEEEAAFYAVRMGLRQVSGLQEEEMLLLIAHRTKPYTTILEVFNSGISYAAMEKLANADAFGSLGLTRRQALWEVSALDKNSTIRKRRKDGTTSVVRQLGLFDTNLSGEKTATLPEMTASEHVVEDYATTAVSLKGHPLSFLREKLRRLNTVTAAELSQLKNGDLVSVAGLVQGRQRPPTAKGTCFMTIEDETGTVNLIIWSNVFEDYKAAITGSKLFMGTGHIQNEQGVTHVIIQRGYNISPLLSDLAPSATGTPVHTPVKADEQSGAPFVDPYEAQTRLATFGKAFPKSRDFR